MLKIFIKFIIVGASGVLVNMFFYTIFIFLGLNHILGATVAFVFAVSNNFYWNFIWTFKNRAQDKSVHKKYIQFFIISFLNFLLGIFILQFTLTYFFSSLEIKNIIKKLILSFDYDKISKILAQLIAIGISSLINFLGNYKITFRKTKEKNIQEVL